MHNSNYKLCLWSLSQAIRLRHINKVFYLSICLSVRLSIDYLSIYLSIYLYEAINPCKVQ